MSSVASTSNGQVLIFGPFRLRLPQRVLHEGERQIRLGSRAFEILITLVERAGDLVSKDEIMARVWPNIATEEATLRVHLSALRRALGHGQNGARYVENVAGRGYRFVAQVTRVDDDSFTSAPRGAASEGRARLPVPLTRIIGRSETIDTLATRLPQRRLISIVGPGGIGKTAVAVGAIDKLALSYRDGAYFADLASLSDPQLIPGAIASVLGLEVLSDNPIPALTAFLSRRHLLLVLDNCEHVVAATASLVETLLRTSPDLQILATSREPLRCEGEWVYRLQPLESPPPAATLTAAYALTFPAIQLFVERATASVDDFELSDADARIVAGLCSRLDGLPLAIELAAARVDLFGIPELAARLTDSFALLSTGRRTAAPRHQTLRATLDWSYSLLTAAEQLILRKLAVFPGDVDLASACAIIADAEISATQVLDSITNLAAKSLVVADVTGELAFFRLLDTTRTYALEKLQAGMEFDAMCRRHADLCCTFWEEKSARPAPREEWLQTHGRKIHDVRAALDWCLSPNADASMGAQLTAASGPLWFQLSLIDEYRVRLLRAIEALRARSIPDLALEMRLHAVLGHALLHTEGPSPGMGAALERSLELAERLDDSSVRWLALCGLAVVYIGSGVYSAAVDFAEKALLASVRCGDDASFISDRFLALAHHFSGNQGVARYHAERALSRPLSNASRLSGEMHWVDHWVGTRATLCRILWLQGFPDQALRTAHTCIEEGLSTDHALSLCYALFGACPVLLWTGDDGAADRAIAMLLDRSTQHSLSTWNVWGSHFALALQLQRGNETARFERRSELQHLPLEHETLSTLHPKLFCAEAVVRAETGHAGWCGAEILRAQGEAILASGVLDAEIAAEPLLQRSLDMSRQQGTLSWELRAATSIARLWRRRGRLHEARDLLAPVYDRFVEGFDTADLITARALLSELYAQ